MYDSAKFLRTCLDSLKAQTLEDIEIICVDDGSKDDTVAIAGEFAAKDGRFKVLRQEHHCAGVARNLGVANAIGECVAFLDADDFAEPDFLARMYDARLKQNAEVVVCGANCYVGATGTRTVEPNFLRMDLLPGGCEAVIPKDIGGVLFNFTGGNPWNKLFLRDFVIRQGFRFLSLRNTEDVFFVYPALATAKRIAVVDSPLVNHRADNPNSLEQTKDESPLAFFEAYEELQEELRRRNLYGIYGESFVRCVAEKFVYNLFGFHSYAAFRQAYDVIRDRGIRVFALLDGVETTANTMLANIRDYECEEYLFKAMATEHAARVKNWNERMKFAQEVKDLKAGIARIKSSKSYRIGRFLTWPVRKIRRVFSRKS